MTDLSDFIPVTKDEVVVEKIPKETVVLIKQGCSFSEVIALATQNRTTHPNEPVEWQKDSNGTFTLTRVVIANGNNQ